jgi:RNA 3'-terminal phosphate cyclase
MLKIKPALSRNRFESFDSFWNATRAHHQLHLVEQGKLIAIKGVSHASALLEEKQVAERQAAAAKSSLVSLGVPTDIRVEYNQTLSPGSGITLWAIFSKRGDDIDERFPIRLGADALGERGKPAEIVGEEAAKHLLEDIKSRAPVDEHLADNLIPLLALCAPSAMKTVRISPHCLTNIFVVEQFLGKLFSVEKNTIRSRLPT